MAAELKAAGRLYPAYETVEELALKRKAKLSQSLPPVYERATPDNIERYAAEGRKPHWRFQLNAAPVEWPDVVHGPMKFNAQTMSDPGGDPGRRHAAVHFHRRGGRCRISPSPM